MATGYIGSASGGNGGGTYSTGLTMTNTYPTSVTLDAPASYYISTFWGSADYFLTANGCTDVHIGLQSLRRDDGQTGTVTVDNAPAAYAPHALSVTLSGETAKQFANKALSIRMDTAETGTQFNGRIKVTVGTAPYNYNVYITSVSNGSASTSHNSAAPGTTVTITPSPASGYRVKSMTSGQVTLTRQSNGTYTFTMPNSNVTVTPEFERDVYTLTLTQPTSGGTITASQTGTVSPGTTITLTNTPATGYVFSNYTVGGTAQTSSTFTMPARSITVTGVFKVNDDLPTFTPSFRALLPDDTVSRIHIKGITRINATITNAAASPPKTVASYLISVSGHGSSPTASYTTGRMASAGPVVLRFTVTDSNGNSGMMSTAPTVYDYEPPSATVTFYRCSDTSMTESAVGTYIAYRATASCAQLDGNNSVQSVTATINGSGTWNLTFDGEKHLLTGFTLQTSSEADVEIEATDVYSSSSFTVNIPTSNFAIFFSGDGTAIGFGKATEHTNSFEINGNRTVYIGDKTLQQYSQVLVVTASNVSSLPRTISNSLITSDMAVINMSLSDQKSQKNDWTWTTADGSVTLNGSVYGMTNITLYLAETIS